MKDRHLFKWEANLSNNLLSWVCMFITLHNDCDDEVLMTQSCQTSCVVGRDMSVTLCNVDRNFLNKPKNSEEKKFACGNRAGYIQF